MSDKEYIDIDINDIKEYFKLRERNTHKGNYGVCGIMGGSLNYSGAIKLANISLCAVRSGTGICRVIVPDKLVDSVIPYLLEQTLFKISSDNEGHMLYNRKEITNALNKLSSLGVGMGWGESENYSLILKEIITEFQGNLLVDADGLNTLSKMNLNILNNRKCKSIVLTPHLMEFSRLTGLSIEEIENDKLNICREFAKKYNIILLLKGSKTIITDGTTLYMVKRGCAGMATAGSGDVLSGIITALLSYNECTLKLISAGAILAGLAGEMAEVQYTDISMKASDTVDCIPYAIKYIRQNQIDTDIKKWYKENVK